MRLSTKCRYGLRAIVDIARAYGKNPAKRKDIAKKQGLSGSYLENILLILRNYKIVETTRGVNGGYVLCRAPSNITVYEVINALEGPLSLTDCVDTPTSCDRTSSCATRFVWCELAGAIRTVLSKITLQELLDREKKSGVTDYTI
jgi:Rrf2 family transcriptional regulator, cysteine metabolism repressor